MDTPVRHPLEIRTGALIVPRAAAKSIIDGLPADALRQGRPITPFQGISGQGLDDLVALHVSHAVASAFACGLANTDSLLGAPAAACLESGVASWVPDLRQLSAECRNLAENEAFLAWAQRSQVLSPSKDENSPTFRFVELFAGIGGFRLGLEALGGRCVLAAELDAGARAIYKANFGEECVGDVVALDPSDLPAHEVLTAGFPCQPFAYCNTGNAVLTGSLQAGPGLLEEKQGALGFEVARILRIAQPPACLLENVPNLCSFNGGADLAALESAIAGAGYVVHCHILDARCFAVPQQRRRLYIVGFRGDLPTTAVATFSWPQGSDDAHRKSQRSVAKMTPCINEKGARIRYPRGPLSRQESSSVVLMDLLDPESSVPDDCRLPPEAWAALRARDPKAVFPSGRGGRIARLGGYARTLTSSYRKNRNSSELVVIPSSLEGSKEDASELAEECVDNEDVQSPPPLRPSWREGDALPRYFTRRECCRLQGFPDDFEFESSERRCKDPGRFYHFIGNAVVPPVVTAVGLEVIKVLQKAGVVGGAPST